ncbi:hypothetical protein BVRB_1g001090 [Beta vulgaris subsp. vulgaris]|nr:hypothetical protein BVRB_1g001090 [Beta vulgaris subsp. vulgaris]
MTPQGKAIGIDLGTTYSCVAVWQNDRVEIIPNDQGNRTTPSYVAFTETERLIGDAAKNQVAMNPQNTVFDAKQYIQKNVSLYQFRNGIPLTTAATANFTRGELATANFTRANLRGCEEEGGPKMRERFEKSVDEREI